MTEIGAWGKVPKRRQKCVGEQARRRTGALSTGIHRHAGGSGCPPTAAVTALNFFRVTQPAFKVAKMIHLTLLPIPHTARVMRPAHTLP
jgi:hypothetical protein